MANLLSAVETILTEAGSPLHYNEITRRILECGLWESQGKTPAATVNAQLAVDIKKHGENSRFQRTTKGMFALRVWSLPEFVASKSPAPSVSTVADEPPAPELPKTYTFLDAAEMVLAQSGDKKPMHYRDITEKALEWKLIHTEGKTPAQTLYAQLVTDIGRRKKRGDPPRFVKHDKGLIGLAKWEPQGLAYQIEQHNHKVRKELHKQLHTMPPAEFETLIGRLLIALGFEDVIVTEHSGDGGIDVRGMLVVGDVIRSRMAVQVKRWKSNIQAPTVQQVRGSLGTHEQGLIITTSDFSKGARHEAERSDATPVALMNGEQLVSLLVEYDIGVHRTAYDLIELGDVEEE